MKTFEEIKNNPKLEILRIGIDGGTGILHMTGLRHCTVIWSFGGGWEHVSICPKNRLPEWDEICMNYISLNSTKGNTPYVKNGVFQMPEV